MAKINFSFFFTFIGSLMLSSIVLFLLYVIKQRRQLKTGMQQNFTKILFREKSISNLALKKQISKLILAVLIYYF